MKIKFHYIDDKDAVVATSETAIKKADGFTISPPEDIKDGVVVWAVEARDGDHVLWRQQFGPQGVVVKRTISIDYKCSRDMEGMRSMLAVWDSLELPGVKAL